jgi:serine/threonine protein kinase/tetratricopeptide (TPR) repeat protein
MTVECPICRAENEADSRICVKCATPFDLHNPTIPWSGGSDPGETIALSPPRFPSSPPIPAASPADEAMAHTPSGDSRPGTPGSDPGKSSFASDQPAAKGVLALGYVLAGRYQILKVLGEGGMGAVYQARDREVDRTVAIKVIRPELSGHPEILRRFKQELILARQVTHRNVIRIFDLNQAEGRRFITMEYVDGKDLAGIVRERKKLPVEEAVAIIRQALMGLEAAHNEGVVHRDLKPQNIMVDGAGRVYLMDFGIAKSMELAGMTRTGVLMGTPDYMSPEQAKGEKADARSDLFTIGVILYELLTGQQPYRCETIMQTLVKRTRERAVPTRELDPSIPQYISDVVSKCLEIDADLRYQSAGQVLRGLDPNAPKPEPNARFDPYAGVAAGTQFGPRYRIESLLGEGGMGKVYKAYDTDLNRLVALKLVRPELASHPESMERLKQELILARRISHKNILRIHDLGDVNGVKFISMAYADGLDLQALIKRKGRLDVEQATNIAKQLCRALEAAHHEGVIHRDLKPQNVLMDQQGAAYILDFGLASSAELGASLAGELMGTPRYMSPEQAESLPLDHRSDLYALGLIIYEMVTGDLPFESSTVMQAMYQRVTQAPKNPRLLNPELPDYLCKIILKCLEKEPEKRYQHASEIIKDLEAGAGVPPRKLSLPLPSARNLTLAGASLAVVLGLMFGVPQIRHKLFRSQTAGENAANAKFVAILPFNVTGDTTGVGYLGQGMADSLSARLAQIKDVHVTSSPYALTKVSDDKTPLDKTPLDQIAHKLGASLLVTGSIQASQDRLEVVVHLNNFQGLGVQKSKIFSGVPQDVLSLENDIYSYLVSEIGLSLSNEELASASTRATTDVAAYDLYLRAQNSVATKRDPESLKQALDLFQRAADKDPSFALAFAGIADTSLRLYNLTKDELFASQAQGAAEHARSLNDKLPEVHFSLGSVYLVRGNVAGAIAELERGANMAPNSDEGWRRLARAYEKQNRLAEAEVAYKKAIEANPYNWSTLNLLGGFYLDHGRYAKATEAYQQVTKLEPKISIGWGNLALVACMEGNYEGCIQASQKANDLEPNPVTYQNIAQAYYFLHKYPLARDNAQKAVALNPNNQLFYGIIADTYRVEGDTERANELYDKAITLALHDLQVNPRDVSTMGNLAIYYARRHSEVRALDFIKRARAMDPNSNELMYDNALIDMVYRRPDDAIANLTLAVKNGFSLKQVASDPDFQGLENDPAFRRLVAPALAAK